jgi:DNA-binding CsgD family transcriptional regulator
VVEAANVVRTQGAAPDYDALIRLIYSAGGGIEPWVAPLQHIADRSAALGVSLTVIEKRRNIVLAHHSAGTRPLEAAEQYAHRFHRIDPRLKLLRAMPVGGWIASEDHFDDAFVAKDPFYQSFMQRFGVRYGYIGKLAEDDANIVVMAHHRGPGRPFVDPAERATIERVAEHFALAYRMRKGQRAMVKHNALGEAVLEQLAQPAILLDDERRIAFRTTAARALFARRDLVQERRGCLHCADVESDIALTLALSELTRPIGLRGRSATPALEQRRLLRLRSAASFRRTPATLFALASGNAPGAAVNEPLALLVIHAHGTPGPVDAELVRAAFDFSVAESRVAARLASGMTIGGIADDLGVSPFTVRSQLKSIFLKVGVRRQSELVGLLLAATVL